MSDNNLEHQFGVLCQITRAQHFAWREAVATAAPDLNAAEIVDKMWEVTGVQTGASYAKRIKSDEPVAPQIAKSVVWSSKCMGEDAVFENGEKGECFVRHDDCPWFHWHKRLGLLAEDRPGCDVWFETAVAEVNKRTGSNVKVETIKALPDGDDCCLRRFTESKANTAK